MSCEKGRVSIKTVSSCFTKGGGGGATLGEQYYMMSVALGQGVCVCKFSLNGWLWVILYLLNQFQVAKLTVCLAV